MMYGPGFGGLPYRIATFIPGLAGFSTHLMSDSLVIVMTLGSGSALATIETGANAKNKNRFMSLSSVHPTPSYILDTQSFLCKHAAIRRGHARSTHQYFERGCFLPRTLGEHGVGAYA